MGEKTQQRTKHHPMHFCRRNQRSLQEFLHLFSNPEGYWNTLNSPPCHAVSSFQIYFQFCSPVLQKMNLGAEAATGEPALITLPDRKYHGGDWTLSLPKLTIYSPILEFSTASSSAACRTALSLPGTWLSLCWGRTRESHCSLFVTQNLCPSRVWGRRRGSSRKPQDAASTPPSDRWWNHQALEEGEWHRTCPWSHEPQAFPETPRGNLPWARNGAGFGGLLLLLPEIACTGACAPSASLDHTSPATRDPCGLWKSESNELCCTAAKAAPKTC